MRGLGAPTAAMFFGLRLVFSVVLSNPILGASVIQTGVQVGWARCRLGFTSWLARCNRPSFCGLLWAHAARVACAGCTTRAAAVSIGDSLSDRLLRHTLSPLLQVAGVVVTAVAVTCYAASQWWSSRQLAPRAQPASPPSQPQQHEHRGNVSEEQGAEKPAQGTAAP